MPKGIPNRDVPASTVGQSYQGATYAKKHNSRHMVELARKHTVTALTVLVKLMNGDGGKMKVLVGESVVEVDVEVPATVRAKCAELIIERGYGKSPQAILLSNESPLELGERTLSVAEKILAIKAARENAGSVVDLEASQQGDPVTVEAEMVVITSTAPGDRPEDLI